MNNEMSFMLEIDYDVKRYRKTLKTDDFYNRFNNFDLVQSYCKQCPRYDTNYSCSPLDINIKEYVLGYDYIDIVVTQLFFRIEDYEKEYSKESLNEVLNSSYYKERDKTFEKILEEENNYPKAQSITGPCNHCAKDCRKKFDKCIHPEIRRFSLASLGLDSKKILKELFDIELLLIEGQLPRYLNNVCSILYTK